jgi:hypothetical protein
VKKGRTVLSIKPPSLKSLINLIYEYNDGDDYDDDFGGLSSANYNILQFLCCNSIGAVCELSHCKCSTFPSQTSSCVS